MRTEISIETFLSNNAEAFNEKKEEFEFCTVVVESERTKGIKSEIITLGFDKGTDDDEIYISCELNRNQALYLKKALEAFIEETEIED